MNRLLPTVVCACCAFLTTPVYAMSGSWGTGSDAGHGTMGHEVEDVAVPYMFNTCAVSGEELGSMGDPIVKVYEGREVKFCCKMCVPRFEKDLDASFAKLDQKIIDSQLPFYPISTCVVSGEEFGGDMGDPINVVYKNRLVRLCCKMCIADFEKDPQAYIKKLDTSVIAQQSKHYPLVSCPISGEELGSMGDAINVVYAGRLVKFCCAMCIPRFEANPIATIDKVDAAWAASKTGLPGLGDD